MENEGLIKFLKRLKFYYDLVDKCLNKKESQIIFRNSFIFSADMTNFKVFNSVSDLMQEELGLGDGTRMEYSMVLINFYKKVFLSYLDKCPDFSNFFVKFSYEFLDNLRGRSPSIKRAIGKEIQNNFYLILHKFEEILLSKCINIENKLDFSNLIIENITHKFNDSSIKKNLKKLSSSLYKFDTSPQYDYLFKFDDEMNLEFYDKIFIKLKKTKIFAKDETKESINEHFIIYDESEFIHENEEEKTPQINFSKNSVMLKTMINLFLMKLTELKVRRLIIVRDEISNISLYEETFIRMGITLYIISSQALQDFQKYTQNFNLISVNLFSYQNYNLENLIKESITQYVMGNEELGNFDMGLDFYLSISKKQKNDNPLQYSRNNHFSIIISGVNIDQCKILKKNTEKLIKMHKLIKTYKFDFISIEKIFESVEEMIHFMKSSEVLPYSQKILEQIFIGYSIKNKLNKCSSSQYFEGVGKM